MKNSTQLYSRNRSYYTNLNGDSECKKVLYRYNRYTVVYTGFFRVDGLKINRKLGLKKNLGGVLLLLLW